MDLLTQLFAISPTQGLAGFVICGLVVAVVILFKKISALEREIKRLNEARISEAMRLSEIISENTQAMQAVEKVMNLFVSMNRA